MPRLVRLVSSVLALAVAAAGPSARPLPKGAPASPPQFVTVAGIDRANNAVTLNETQTTYVPYTETETREENGKKVQVKVTRLKSEFRLVQKKFDVKSGKVYDAAGKLVRPSDLWRRLSVGATVLVSSDGKRLQPAWRQALTRSALIFVTSPSGAAAEERKE